MNLFSNLSYLWFLLIPTIVSAESIQLQLFEQGRPKPIKRVEVRIDKQVLFSDPQGIVNLEFGNDSSKKVFFKATGYETLITEISELQKTDGKVYLYPILGTENQVFIKGEKRNEISRKKFSNTEAEKVAPGGDPAQITKLLPGVSSNTFGTDIAVRGSDPEDSNYYIDGFRVNNIYHNIGEISILPAKDIADVVFYAGGFGSQFGDASGGIVQLKTSNELPELNRTSYRINIPFYSGIRHQRRVSENSSLTLATRYSYLQYILPSLLPDDASTTVTPYFGDASIQYLKLEDDGGYYKVLLLGSQDGLDLVSSGDIDQGTDQNGEAKINIYSGYTLLGFNRYKPIGSGWFLDLSPYLYYQVFDSRFFDYTVDIKNYSFATRMEFSKRIGRGRYLYLGLEPEVNYVNVGILAPEASDEPFFDPEDANNVEVERKLKLAQLASWVSADFSPLSEKILFTPGLRISANSQVDEMSFDPRLSIKHKTTPKLNFGASVGQYSQAPQPQEADPDYGNDQLGYEKSMHYILASEYAINDFWDIEFQLFYKNMRNKIINSQTDNFSNDGQSRSRGAELFLRRKLSNKAFGWLSYTFAKAEVNTDDGTGWRYSEYDERHHLKLSGNYRFSSFSDVGFRFYYRSGERYTPATNVTYNSEVDRYQPEPSMADRNSAQLKNYHQLDLFQSLTPRFNESTLTFKYGVQYLAFTEQEYAMDYNYDYSEQKPFTGLPPIPFIEVKGEF